MRNHGIVLGFFVATSYILGYYNAENLWDTITLLDVYCTF